MDAGCTEQDRTFYRGIGLAGVLIALVLTAANAWLGSLNQDEGWYLLAARMVYGGAMPYRDFAFTQAPVMPVLYAPLTPLMDAGGLLAGRVLTAVFGWLTAWIAALLAARLVKPEHRRAAFWMTWILVSVNVYQSYFTTIVKTYAAAGLLLAAGFYLLISSVGRLPRGRLAAAAAALVLAAGTRISLVVVAPFMALALWRMRRAWPAAWLWFVVGGLVAAAWVFVPFAVAAPEGLWFGMVEYHTARSPGGGLAAMALKAGFVSRMAQAYSLAVLVGLVWVAHGLCFGWRDGSGPVADDPAAALRRAAAWSLLVVTAIHGLSPFPYDDYQVMLYAPACALLSAAWVRRLSAAPEPAHRLRFVTLCFLGAATVTSFASPINQDWFVSGRDRIWWHLKAQPDLRVLRQTAATVRALCQAGGGGGLLTQDPYLAIEAGCMPPVAMAMGPFSYFPDLPTDRARRLQVMNREILLDILRQSTAPVAAFSGYGLAIASPAITPLPETETADLFAVLEERYEWVETVPSFGQAHTPLRIYRLRPPDPSGTGGILP